MAAPTLPSVGKGTLIVFVTTRDGTLLCADKRLTHGPNDYRDDSTKLAQIGPNIVFAVSGVPYIEARDGYGNGYDAVTIVNDYFAKSQFEDSVFFWNGVKQRLFDNFIAYLKPRPYDAWPPTLFPEANHSFTQLLFFFSDKNDRMQVKLIQLRYMKQSKPVVEVRSFDVQPYGLYDSLGWSKLDHELKKGHDHRFNDLREDAVLKPFLTNKLPVADVTTDLALVFSKRLIEVSNKRGPELGDSPEDIGIGLTCDCVLVKRTGSVEWIGRNLNVEKSVREGSP